MLNIIGTYKKSGIYKIVNLMTEQVYVGSSKDMGKRLSGHYKALLANKHPSKYLQHSWNKYGERMFVAEVIEFCQIENLIVKEQYWIDTLQVCDRTKGFNLTPTAYSQLGRKQSLEEIEKRKRKFIGRTYSKEAKLNMSQGRVGMKFSASHCANISKVKKGIIAFTKPVLQYDKAGNFITEWSSSADASRILNIHYSGIANCIKGLSKSAGGFIWKLKSKIND